MRTFTQKWVCMLMTLLCCLALPQVVMAQDCVSIGDGTTKNNNFPICSYYYGSYTQQLFLASELELNGAVNITSVAFQYDYTNSTKRKISIFMANTEATSLSSAYVTDGFEEVLSATEVTFDNSADWFTIDLETPFAYDGTSNLVVAVYMDYLSTQTEYNSNSRFRYTTATGMARYTTNDNAAVGDLTVVNGVLTANNYSSGIGGTSSSNRANMQFCYTTGSAGPTCDKPTDLDFTGVTAKSATLNWAGGSGTYDVEYQVNGAEEWAFAVKNSTATSATLNNLIPNTKYNVRVKAKCDGGVESGYKTGSFTTAIGIPYLETFNGTTSAWSIYTGTLANVMAGTEDLVSTTSFWSFTTANGVFDKHAKIEVYSTRKAWLISPEIPLEENLQMSFDLALTHWTGDNVPAPQNPQPDARFVVLITQDDGATWTILREWNNTGSEYVFDEITCSATGELIEIPLSDYSIGTAKFAFYVEHATGGDNNLHLDNLLIDYAPTCLKPTHLHEVEGGVSKNSIQVAWEHAGAQQFKVQYKQATEDVWVTVDATDTTCTITGLAQFTEYNIRVAAFCDVTDSTTLTDYCKQITVKTATGVPFEQNFNVSALPSEWKRYDTKLSAVQNDAALEGTADGWKTMPKAQANNIFDSAYHVVLNIADTMNYWLVSPTIEMIAGQQLTFDLALTTKEGGPVTAGAQPDDVFEVLVYADGEWNELGIWANGGQGTQFDAINSSSNGQTIKFEMDAYAGKNIRLAFYGESSISNGDNNLHIANLKIDVKPACTPAMSLSIEDLDVTSATAVWTTDEPGSVWQYGMIANPAADFVPADEDFVNDTTALSVALTGLTAETTYAFFLRHACDNGNSDPIVRIFTTYPAPKTVPWTETFEAYDENTIAPYWDNSASASTTISSANPHYIWGVYSYSSNKMIRMYNAWVQKGTAIINTPRINLAPENGCMLSFDYTHAASCDPFSVRISTDNGKTWTELASYAKTASSNNATNPGTFTKAEINLAAYAGQIVMLQFYAVADYVGGAIFVDNIKIDQLPDCLKPTNLVVSNVSAHGATFSWDNEEGAAWEYVCVPDTITELPAYTACAQNSLQLETLDAKTDYVFYLRRVCGENSVSDSIFATFKTLPEPKTMPFAENFNGLASGAIPEDWDNSEGTTTTATSKWVFYAAANGDSCVRFNSYSNTSGNTNFLATPPILLSEAAMLSFRWKNPTGGAGEIFISNDGGATRTSLKNNLTGVANWSTYEIDLSDYTNDIVNIYFKGTSNYGNGDAYLYLDDVAVKALPTCFKPDSLAAIDSLATINSMTIDWAPVGNETHWLVQYKKSSESAWMQIADSILAHPYTLVGLDHSTNYDVRVAAWCNEDDASEFSDPIHFATLCAPVTEFPYKEGFDSLAAGTSGHMLPLCWDYINTCTSTSYNYYPTAYKGATAANTPNNYLRFFSYYTSSATYTAEDQYAILPEMDALNTMRLKLNARANGTSSYYDATFYVGIMSDPTDTATFVVIDTIQPTSTTYAPYVIPFNGYTGTGKHIAIMIKAADNTIGTSSYSYRSVYIDDIEVEEIPNCLEPADLVVLDSLTTWTSATFTWTVQGEETAWVLQYKKYADEEWTNVVATTDTFTLEGLESATMYVARVAAQCGETETSRYTDQITFVTSCGAWSIAEHNYTEGFEAYEGAAFNATNGVVPVCWDAMSSGDVAPHVIAPTDQYAYVHGGEKALTFYGSGYCYAALPVFAEPLNTLRISFWAGMESATNGTLKLGYITNENPDVFHEIETYDHSLKTDMKQHVTDLMAVPDSAARLVFEWYYSSQWSCCIDDIEVMPLPNCFEPKGLDVKLTRGNGSVATLNWVDTVATSWVVEYSLHADMSDAISVPANDTTIELTGLMSDSTYYARVKSICGENEESTWSSLISFVPTSAIIINDGTTTSSYVPFYGSGVNNATQSQFIIPEKEIELLKWDSITQLTFYSSTTYKNQSWTGSKFEVYVAETTDTVLTAMLDWTDMTKVMNAKHLELVDQQMVVTLDKPFQYQGGNIVIGFKLTTTGSTGYCYWYGKSGVSGNAVYQYNSTATLKSNFNPKMRIAHVQGVVPTCLVVKNVEASEITASSAQLSWTNGEESQNAWQIAYSCDPAFNLASVTAEQIVDAATNPYVLTGLLPDTLYNVYVRANCSEAENEDYSLWSKLCTFTTASACQTPTDLAAANITNVSASISWNSYGQTGFNLRYSTNGTLWLDTIENITDAPYVLNGLTANEHYYVQVQNDCNVEEWSETLQFKTMCNAWSIALDGDYTEDFENYTGTAYNVAGVAPDCWEIGGTSTYVPHVVTGTSYAWTHSGINSFGFTGSANSYCYAVLPQFEEDLNRLQISLWTRMESTSYGTLSLGYITEAADMIYVLKSYPNLTTMTYYEDKLDTIPAEAARLVLLWQYSGSSYYSCTVDDINVSFIPTCIKPENVTASEIAGHSAKISWTPGEAGQTAWQIAYDTIASKQPDTLANVIDVIDSVYQIMNLYPQKKYYVYVRANCGDQDGMSKWSDGIYFTTTVACPAPTGLEAKLTPGNGSIATLSWVAGDAQAWQVEYSLNSNMTDSIVLNVTEAQANLTGLTAEATYYARVKADCGELDGKSAYSAVISFTPTNKYEMIVNDGTSTNTFVPVQGSYVDEGTASQFIVPAASLEALEWDSIKALTFYSSSSNSTWGASEWEIYMTEVKDETLAALADWNDMTQVMTSGSLALVNGKMVVTLTDPYYYQGGNLLIGFKQTVTSGSSSLYSSATWYGVTANGASIGGHGTGGTSMAQRNFLPKMNIEYVPGVVPACPNPKYLAISEITDNSAVASWKAVEGATWEYALVAGEAEPTVYISTELNEITLSNLDDATDYVFYLRRACGENTYSDVLSVEFTTEAFVATLPFAENFEGENHWKLINGTEPNAWYITDELYISNDGGVTNQYTNSVTSRTFATILINFEATGTYTVAYNWKANGDYDLDEEEAYDYLRVALVPEDAEITTDMAALPTGHIALDNGGLYGATDWQHLVKDDVEITPGLWKLLVAWFNDDSDGDQTPAAIDNISIKHKAYPTDIESGAGIESKAVKFIYNDQVYILLNGAVYNITGQKVELK